MKQLIERIHNALAHMPDRNERNAIARVVCCDLLGLGTTSYYLKEEVTLTALQEERLADILGRLGQGEPLQYIEGRAPFCGMDFAVEQGVLIPRPETAELVDWIAQEHGTGQPRILDMGTGSGCIAIALDRRIPGAKVEACDLSEKALAVAEENNRGNGTQVSFFRHDILDKDTPLPHSYDIIVSNPPYIMQSEQEEMEQHVTGWEPHMALFVPDDDALLFYRAIAETGMTDALNPGGAIYVEINQRLGAETVALFESYGYREVTLRRDIYGNDRMVKGVKTPSIPLKGGRTGTSPNSPLEEGNRRMNYTKSPFKGDLEGLD